MSQGSFWRNRNIDEPFPSHLCCGVAADPSNPQGASTIPAPSNTLASLEPLFQDSPGHYVPHASTRSQEHAGCTESICDHILMFLQMIVWHPDGLSALEPAIPWTDLAVFLMCAPHIPPTHLQSDKLDKHSMLSEDWAICGMAQVG
jgi:hypothetical protein